MTKYRPLTEFLEGKPAETVRLSFEDVARILGRPLPASAYKYREWWANNPSGHSHARAWVEAGWRSEQVDMEGRTLVFRRLPESRPARRAAGRDPFGAMKGTVTVRPGWDLAEPTGEEWDAEAGRI